MQLNRSRRVATVQAYGIADNKQQVIKNGIITDTVAVAKQIDDLLSHNMIGRLSTNRVVMAIPVAYVFTRILNLPIMSRKELADAVKLEVDQSIPASSKDLYYDYEMTDVANSENMLVRLVAVPRAIVDSYEATCDLLKLDLSLIQTNIRADAQVCSLYEDTDAGSPYIILDVGRNSIDIGVLDDTLRITGTVDAGGDDLTKAIEKELSVSHDEAHEIKVGQGISAGKNQKKVVTAVSPILGKVEAEIKKILRFYEERVSADVAVSQILIVGGGANMPGLGDHLTNATHIATRVAAPWGNKVRFGKLEPPQLADLPRFLTCAGLALADEQEIVS